MVSTPKSLLIAAVAMGCSWSLSTMCLAQSVTCSTSSAPVQHLGNGPIDLNNLPADVLQCDICRQRLGLPPLPSKVLPPSGLPTVPMERSMLEPVNAKPMASLTTNPGTQAPLARTLGSPGLISPSAAAAMASSGLVVEEFIPPQSRPDAIQLGGIPPEARQQFLQSLDLPFGARILSANVLGQGTPGPAGPAANEPKLLESKQADQEKAMAEKIESIMVEKESLAQDRAKLTTQMAEMQFEWKKSMEQANKANREVLNMLEKRTAEVSELQAQLKTQQEIIAARTAKDAEASEQKKADSAEKNAEKKDSPKKKQPKKKKDDKVSG